MPDSTCLLSAGGHRDPTIREWDASTWTQVGNPWTGHTEGITAIAVNFGGTMIAFASRDNHVRLWQLLLDVQHCHLFLYLGHHGRYTYFAL